MAREYYIVCVDRPDDVTVTEMKDYIQTAVGCWSGGMDPQEPLFDAFRGYGKGVYVQRMGLGARYVVQPTQWADRNRQGVKLERDRKAERNSSKGH